MFTIEHLRFGYQKGKEVLKGLDLSMETGKIQGFAGLNGAGKTTFLNLIYHFIRPSDGKITYNGHPLLRREVSYLEAENYFYPYMTGREYLELFPAGGGGFDMERWRQLFSLPLDDIVESYSTGMRKKLALLAALKPDKPVLILDEPFNGLDLESAHLLTMILAQLRTGGKTILITSHIYESLAGCCDVIHYLSDGQIARSYTREEFPLLQDELQSIMEERFGGLIAGLIPSQ
ncbi:MAG: ABC transporter ATP-binding protein [Tannerellaceae bacterium]|jgi:ABC-2 type transport system ATP-binding protein|nr:ABC transporter ATP-binding protein [Tannerellaceae bacterium]